MGAFDIRYGAPGTSTSAEYHVLYGVSSPHTWRGCVSVKSLSHATELLCLCTFVGRADASWRVTPMLWVKGHRCPIFYFTEVPLRFVHGEPVSRVLRTAAHRLWKNILDGHLSDVDEDGPLDGPWAHESSSVPFEMLQRLALLTAMCYRVKLPPNFIRNLDRCNTSSSDAMYLYGFNRMDDFYR